MKTPRLHKTAALVAGLFFHVQAAAPWAQANFWEDRRAAQGIRQSMGPGLTGQMPLLPPVASEKNLLWSLPERAVVPPSAVSRVGPGVPDWIGSLPAAYGDVQRVYLNPRPTPAPFVVLIQDAHQIYSAQINIARMIGDLEAKAKSEGLGTILVGVEGTAGPLHLAPYRDYALKDIHAYTAEYLLRQGFISGAEYHGMLAPEAPRLWGVEDAGLYLENVDAFQASLPRKDDFHREIQGLKNALEAAKESIYNLDLWALDKNVAAYHKGELDLLRYVKHLTSQGIDAGLFPQTARLLDALALEESLDFKRVEADRAQLLEALARRLEKNDLQLLLETSMAYRAGTISYAPFYSFLKDLSARHGVALGDFPAFNRYIAYVLAAERIDRPALFDEMEGLKEAVIDRLARTPAQRELMRLGNDLRLLERLSEHGLNPQEWALYAARRDELLHLLPRAQFLVESVGQLGPQLKTPMEEFLTAFERFYVVAHRRNDAMVRNLLRRAQTTGARGAVMVAGGFHTGALENIFRARGVSFVTLTPKVGEVPAGSAYLDVFTAKRTPLERLLLGEKLMLAPASGMGHFAGDQGRRGEILSDATVMATAALAAGLNADTAKATEDLEQKFGVDVTVSPAERRGPSTRVHVALTGPNEETDEATLVVVDNPTVEPPLGRDERIVDPAKQAGPVGLAVVGPKPGRVERLGGAARARLASWAPALNAFREQVSVFRPAQSGRLARGFFLMFTALTLSIHGWTNPHSPVAQWAASAALPSAVVPVAGILTIYAVLFLMNAAADLIFGAPGVRNDAPRSPRALLASARTLLLGTYGFPTFAVLTFVHPGMTTPLVALPLAVVIALVYRTNSRPVTDPAVTETLIRSIESIGPKDAAAVINSALAAPETRGPLADLAEPLAETTRRVESPLETERNAFHTGSLARAVWTGANDRYGWIKDRGIGRAMDLPKAVALLGDARVALAALADARFRGGAGRLTLAYYAWTWGMINGTDDEWAALRPHQAQDLARLSLSDRRFFGWGTRDSQAAAARFSGLTGLMETGRQIMIASEERWKQTDTAAGLQTQDVFINLHGVAEDDPLRDFHFANIQRLLAAKGVDALAERRAVVFYSDEDTRRALAEAIDARFNAAVARHLDFVPVKALEEQGLAARGADGGVTLDLPAFMLSRGMGPLANTAGVNIYSPLTSTLRFQVPAELQRLVYYVLHMVFNQPIIAESANFEKIRGAMLKAAQSA